MVVLEPIDSGADIGFGGAQLGIDLVSFFLKKFEGSRPIVLFDEFPESLCCGRRGRRWWGNGFWRSDGRDRGCGGWSDRSNGGSCGF